MKKWVTLMLMLITSSHAFADSTSEELRNLREKVQQLEEKEEIENLKIRIKKLEERQAVSSVKAVRSPARIRPFIGATVGGLRGNSKIKLMAGGGFNFGVTGKHIGSSLNFSSFDANDRWLVSYMLNIYGLIPIRNRASVEIANVKLGGGVSRNYSYYSEPGTGYQVDVGIDYWLGTRKKISVGVDILHLFFTAKEYPGTFVAVGRGGFIQKNDINLNTLIGLLNLTYHFR